jgi:steroid delta-isomerase-like uncharacterized protein
MPSDETNLEGAVPTDEACIDNSDTEERWIEPRRSLGEAAQAGLKAEEKPMSAYRELLDRYVELYNAGDLDGVLDLYADDGIQIMPDGMFEGRNAIYERLARELEAFPDVHHTVRSFIEQGDTFADEWTFAGTHTGPFLLPNGSTLPPTGKSVEIRGMEVVRVRPDGTIVLNSLYYDNLAVAVQLGLVPEGALA